MRRCCFLLLFTSYTLSPIHLPAKEYETKKEEEASYRGFAWGLGLGLLTVMAAIFGTIAKDASKAPKTFSQPPTTP